MAVHAVQKLGKRHAIDILHNQVGIGCVVRKVDDLHDVGMLKHGGGVRLAQDIHDVAGGHTGTVDKKGDALNGDAAARVRVAADLDGPKPPVASVSSGWYRLSSSRELVPSKERPAEPGGMFAKSGMANPRAFKVRFASGGRGGRAVRGGIDAASVARSGCMVKVAG